MFTPEDFGPALTKEGGALGAWCTFTSFSSVEMMAGLGFDFLIVDLQHCEITQSHLPALLGAFKDQVSVPVVRAPKNDYHIINWLFDQGASAVLVPMVNSVEDARRAVEAARFPPLGRRSFGPFRSGGYSYRLASYMRRADELATLIVQVESGSGVRDLEAILELDGVDAVFLGPNDLAFSMLKPGESLVRESPSAEVAQMSNFARGPEVVVLCEEAMRKCRSAGKPFGLTTGSLDEARQWLSQGASFVTCGSDLEFLRVGAKRMCDLPRE